MCLFLSWVFIWYLATLMSLGRVWAESEEGASERNYTVYVHLSIYLSIRLSVHMPVCSVPTIYLYIYLSILSSINQSIRPSVCPSIHPSKVNRNARIKKAQHYTQKTSLNSRIFFKSLIYFESRCGLQPQSGVHASFTKTNYHPTLQSMP